MIGHRFHYTEAYGMPILAATRDVAIPHAFWLVTIMVFGAIIGSFLNCYIYRWPRRISVLKRSRSFCPRCQHNLAWYDNIPILSWTSLIGRCRYCGAPISWMYPTVEALTAGLFGLTYYTFRMLNPNFPVAHVLVLVALIAALIAIAFVDCQVKRIPSEITYSGILLAPVLSFLVPSLHRFQPAALRFFDQDAIAILIPHTPHRLDAVVSSIMWGALSGGILLALGVIWRVVRNKYAMGEGDMLMMAMVGGLLGHYGFISIFVAATVGTLLVVLGGLIIGLVRYAVADPRERKFELPMVLPFGPLLAIGIAIMIFWGPLLIGGYLYLLDFPRPIILDYVCPLIDARVF
jgi:leader peptidase (prepilin peptidase)/N-methyltransferase